MNELVARVAVLTLLALVASACAETGAHGGDAAASAADANCGPCPLWTVRCGGRCVDPTMSPNNCGVCGVACDTSSQVCQGGVCAAASRCAALDAGALGTPSDGGTPPRTDASHADASPAPDAHATDAGTTPVALPGAGLRGEYFGGPALTDLRFVRLDATIDFDWTMAPAAPMYPSENYSVRWTGTLRAPATDTYSFHVTADDNVRVWIDGALVLDAWTRGVLVDAHFDQALDATHGVSLRVEYRQLADMASVHFLWSTHGGAMVPVPASALAPAIGDAWTCATGECCAVGATALCCPTGMTCVQDPSFHGCCPVGEVCTAVAACGT